MRPPKNYYVFQRIFGSEQRKHVLVAFLNDMLGLDEAHRIVRVDLLSREQRPAIAELELSIVGAQCTDARGVVYVVEMQVFQVEGFEKRIVENVVTAYVNQTTRATDPPTATTSSASRLATSRCGPISRRFGCRC